jgi:hypothetical protein
MALDIHRSDGRLRASCPASLQFTPSHRRMRYLCLIYWDEQKLATLPADELNALNAAHLDFNDELRRSGHYIEAEALQPSRESRCLRVKQGKPLITDGPFTEAKEMVAGFYLLEVRASPARRTPPSKCGRAGRWKWRAGRKDRPHAESAEFSRAGASAPSASAKDWPHAELTESTEFSRTVSPGGSPNPEETARTNSVDSVDSV